MTNGLELGDVYGTTIKRIKAQDGDKSRLGMTALLWISHTERPLQEDELCYALAVQLGSTEFDVGNIPSMSTLVNCCQGLITVDKEASTVRLIHFTLQEYLSAHLDIFSKPHAAMAEICLTYLNSKQVKALSTAHSSDTWNAPFLQYCSVYWGVHARRDLSDCGKLLALELLKEDYSQISTKFLFAHQFPHLASNDTWHSFSGLHCASFFGIVEVVTALIEVGGSNIDGEGLWGMTPLSCAARNGHDEVVKILLQRGEVDPDKASDKAHTASGRKDRELWKLKVRNPVARLARAHRILQSKPQRPDHRFPKFSTGGCTPLSFAAGNGHEGVVKILLGREEVNPNKPDNGGRTPLFFAAQNGREGVVKILLGRGDVNPDMADRFGQTPISYAAEYGHEGVVKILLERKEVNPDTLDTWGQTPLWYAVKNEYDGVVKILLEREEVNPDKLDGWGDTPLLYAARWGYKKIVELLQSRKAATPSTT